MYCYKWSWLTVVDLSIVFSQLCCVAGRPVGRLQETGPGSHPGGECRGQEVGHLWQDFTRTLCQLEDSISHVTAIWLSDFVSKNGFIKLTIMILPNTRSSFFTICKDPQYFIKKSVITLIYKTFSNVILLKLNS